MSDPGYHSGPLAMDNPGEGDRLRLLAQQWDPHTRAVLAETGPKADWRCLELGAGTGAIAYWLAEQCPAGHVTAVDIDTRHLDPARAPNLTVRQADVTVEEFPAGSFDLVHARMLLCHLPERERLLARAARWLTPGGWLVVEEPYFLPTEGSRHPALARLCELSLARLAEHGSDLRWATRLPGLVADLGLTEVTTRTESNCLGGGGVRGQLTLATVRQFGAALVDEGRITPAEVDQVLATVARPDFLELWSLMVSVLGRSR